MSSLLTLALQAATSVLCSLALIALLRTPLTRTLNRVCPNDDAAAFWWAYATAMLAAAPLALVLLVNLLAPGTTTVDQLRGALLTSLCGLLWGMHLLGRKISAFVSLPSAARTQPNAQRASTDGLPLATSINTDRSAEAA